MKDHEGLQPHQSGDRTNRAELLHAQILELHASGGAKVPSKSAAARAASCWKQSDSETNDLLLLHICAAKILLHNLTVAICLRKAQSSLAWALQLMLIAPHSWVLL